MYLQLFNFFSKFVDYPVISDDSGICIKSLNNKPGIYTARLAKRHGSFFKAMNFILKSMRESMVMTGDYLQALDIKNQNGTKMLFHIPV